MELNHPVEELDTDIVQFFNQREAYQELGIAHRRGSLVYGPPGNGKTFTILRIVQRLAEEKDCLAFYIPSSIGYQLEELNNFEPVFRDQPTILILEEITDHAQDRREMLLSLLDGEQSWTHNYVIATTNYPDRLPANIVDRPGRFDRLLEVSMPDGQQRRDYLEFHLPQSTVDRVLVEKTEGFSLAYLKELVLRSQLRSDNPLEVVKQFKQQKQKMSQAFDCPDGQLGFSVNGDSSV